MQIFLQILKISEDLRIKAQNQFFFSSLIIQLSRFSHRWATPTRIRWRPGFTSACTPGASLLPTTSHVSASSRSTAEWPARSSSWRLWRNWRKDTGICEFFGVFYKLYKFRFWLIKVNLNNVIETFKFFYLLFSL